MKRKAEWANSEERRLLDDSYKDHRRNNSFTLSLITEHGLQCYHCVSLRVGMTVPLSRKWWPVFLVTKPAPTFITIQHRETWLCQKNVMPENVVQNQPVITRSSARHLLQKELQSRSVKSTAARVTCAMEPECHWRVRFCSWHAPF